jgi:hypothetical protein
LRDGQLALSHDHVSMNDADLVLADLRDALHALHQARGSPKEVRRAFSRFVDLSQRLTAAMRKDFARLRHEPWQAKSFDGWNKVTEFFKWLRNQDQHETSIRISVHERHFYANPLKPDELFKVEGTWVLTDQLVDTPSGGVMKFRPIDLATGRARPAAEPVLVEYQYLVQPHSESARARLQEIGTTDMHILADAAFRILEAYHTYFLECLGA